MKIENKDKEILFSKEAREFFGVESKYFTPDIEDIRVGYECETDDSIGKQIWTKCIIDPDELWGIMERSLDGALGVDIRTLYLTQEQIKAEGWILIGLYPGEAIIYKKAEYECLHSTKENKLKITKVWKSFGGEPDERIHRKDVFNGECKSINELRIIQKMLRI